MKRYRKKPVVIEATQFTDADLAEDRPNSNHVPGVVYSPSEKCAHIQTLEGVMRVDLGDWIIRGVKGELYPCKPETMTDPTPLQLMDRLLDALKEAGIRWCQGAFCLDETGDVVPVHSARYYRKAGWVCMSGALHWAVFQGVLTLEERSILRHSLKKSSEPGSILSRNDNLGWDFARFREELARREGEDA